MLAATLTALTISVYDLSHDPKRVVIEACDGTQCVSVVVPRARLTEDEALDAIAEKIALELRHDKLAD